MLIYDNKLFSDYAEFFVEGVCFDRTGYFGHKNKIKVLQKIPVGKKLDFETLCYQRAKELISRGKTIYLLWSGGIDSSLVLALLEQSGITKDQLVIMLSIDAFKVNPIACKTVLSKYNFEFVNKLCNKSYSDGLLLSGIGMDMLIHDTDLKTFKPESLDDLFEKMSKKFNKSKNEYKELALKMSELVGVDCNTCEDFNRIKCLVFFWQIELVMIGFLTGCGVYGVNYENFFTTEDFQSWSLYYPAKSLSGFDSFGNKKISSDMVKKLNPDYVTTNPMDYGPSIFLFFRKKILASINDNWQYTYEP